MIAHHVQVVGPDCRADLEVEVNLVTRLGTLLLAEFTRVAQTEIVVETTLAVRCN